jgi:hypothetical protein
MKNLVRCNAVYSGRRLPTFSRIVVPLPEEFKSKPRKIYSSNFRMEVVRSSETSINVYQISQRHIFMVEEESLLISSFTVLPFR